MSAKHSGFVHHLSHFNEAKNLQALAILRRSLSQPPGTDIGPYKYLGRFLSEGTSPKSEKVLCLIAGLYALAPCKPMLTRTSLGATLAAYCADKPGAVSGVERRLTALLNAHRDDLPKHLRYTVALLRQSDQSIDWIQLTDDLSTWERSDRKVQRKWAKDFWGRLADAGQEQKYKKERTEDK